MVARRSVEGHQSGWETIDVYDGRSKFPYTFDEVGKGTKKDHLACVGALCAVFLGKGQG